MQNHLEMEAVSVRLYKYMCEEIVGTENIVRYRRLYYKLYDDMFTDNQFEFISSGSKAEGLDFPGSDYDFMILLKLWEVYEDQPKDTEDVLILDTDNALPGFALLKKIDSSSFPFSPTLTANGNLIYNRDFFNIGFNMLSDDEEDNKIFKIHGPCTSNSLLLDFDMSNCLKCHSWPTIAKRWLLRFRPSGWPSQDIISKIVSQGCLLVPIGSKSLGSEGNPFEWRFSFSLSEKLLVHSFNQTQLLCYALLKIWLKEILNSDNILNNKLCSYFMKTVLFWILEEDENLNWVPQNLLHCFLLCIHRLHYWIACGYFPNYFIPEHNMIDGKLTHDILAYLSLTLDNMNIGKNWNIMLSVPSFRNFWNHQISIQRKPYRLYEFDEAVLSLLTIGCFILFVFDELKEYNLSEQIIYRMIHKHLPKSARNILILMFLRENMNILASLKIANLTDKRGYLDYKECLSRILINTFHDAEFGWLFLAAFFYSTKQNDEMSCILELASDIFSFTNSFAHDDVDIQSITDMSKLRKIVYSKSLIKRMRYEISQVPHIDFTGKKNINNYEYLSQEIPEGGFFGRPKLTCFIFFLKYLHSHKQGNSLETQSALQLLKTVSKDQSDTTTNISSLLSSISFLEKVYEISEDEEANQICTYISSKCEKLFKEFDVFSDFSDSC